MKKAYLAISYSNRKFFTKEIDIIKTALAAYKIDLLVFVDEYDFSEDEEKLMMKTAFKTIADSDLLIAELTTKSVGVGIEIGYAYAKQKPIIYLRKFQATQEATASGSANHTIVYENEAELFNLLNKALNDLEKTI